MKKCPYHLASILCLLLSVAASAQVLPFTHYTPDSDRTPLPSAEVQQVYQDRQGYIWMVIYSSGLARYNGSTLDLYTTDDGLRDLNVRHVLEDQLGRLWVASDAGLVVSEEPITSYAPGDRIRFIASMGPVPLLNVATYKNRIATDEQGWLWVGTDSHGIIRYRVDGLGQTATDTIGTALYDERQNLTVRSIAMRRDGSVWVGLSGGRLLVLRDEARHVEVFSGAEEPSQHYTAVLYESPSGTLWGGESNGRLWRLEETEGERSIMTVSTELDSEVASMTASSDRRLWVASAGSGLLRINLNDTSDRTVYTRRNGLLSEGLRHVMQDREGNIWIGQSRGVSKLRANYAAFAGITATSYAGETPMLPASGVNAVVVAMHHTDVCSLWAGTSEGLACLGKDGSSAYVQETQGLRNSWVNALTFDQTGRLWLGTFAGINGLALQPPALFPTAAEEHTFTLKRVETRVAGYRGTSIVAAVALPMPLDEGDAAGIESLWFPGYKSLYCLVDNAWFVFRASSGLPPTWYHAVAYDREGRLWVGTRDHGLYRSKSPLTLAALGTMERVDVPFVLGNRKGTFGSEGTAPVFEPVWSTSSGAPTNRIESLIWHDGVLWVGTPEGVFTLEDTPPRVTTHLTRQEGLTANNVLTMAASPATGSLWVGTNGGLAEIDPETRSVIRTVTKQDGLLDNEVWYHGSVAVGEDETVYFGTASGLAIYRPREDRPNPVEPLPQVEQIYYVEDRNGNNEIEITYAGLSFANEKQVRYRTRLVGYDADWSPEKTDAKIRYTNLPAFFTSKRYTFEVVASNNDGVWTPQPVRSSFYVRPAWWLRWWSFALYTVVLGAALFALDRVQRQRLIRKEREKALERELEQARELKKAYRALDESHQHLVATQTQLIQQEKMASLGQLTAGIAHEMKNPLNFINNFAELNAELSEELVLTLSENPEARLADVQDVLADLKLNAERIGNHGRRADSIVRSMMEHAIGTTGKREPTDMNALFSEYIGLAYHGMRAQRPDFHCVIEEDYDDALGTVELVPQEMGRVFLNLLNNAFYAVYERARSTNGQYRPTVAVHTRRVDDKAELRVKDNGPGIPRAIRSKVFEPFFTTKPTGSATGLGLFLSYDIVVLGHGGTLTVESTEGEGTTFVVTLPIHESS